MIEHVLRDGESMSRRTWAVLTFMDNVESVPVFYRNDREGWVTAINCTPIRLLDGVVIEESKVRRWTATRTGDEITITVESREAVG